MTEKKLQAKYYEFQQIEEQIKQVTNQLQELNNKILELEYLKTSLDEISGYKKGDEILAPLSSGIFVKAKLEDTKELLVNVGSGTVIGKDIDSTKKLMDGQIEEIENIRHQYMHQMQELTVQAQQVEADLKTLLEEKDV